MVPIYETDVAEERWAKSGWESYELWEKMELRLRRKRRLWVLAALALFLMLSSVPVVMDRKAKWRSLSTARLLAQEISRVERLASLNHAAYRLRFTDPSRLNFVIEKAPTCASTGQIEEEGRLGQSSPSDSIALMTPEQGRVLGINGLMIEFCYDYMKGDTVSGTLQRAFAFLPVNDLTERRLDRASVLMLAGTSAEISFD